MRRRSSGRVCLKQKMRSLRPELPIGSGTYCAIPCFPPSTDLLNRLKRLLDTDRNLGRSAKSTDPEKATYAFFSQDAAGSGIEVRFLEYEAFALLTGWRFLEQGFPQQKAVLARIFPVPRSCPVEVAGRRSVRAIDEVAVVNRRAS